MLGTFVHEHNFAVFDQNHYIFAVLHCGHLPYACWMNELCTLHALRLYAVHMCASVLLVTARLTAKQKERCKEKKIDQQISFDAIECVLRFN